MVSSESSFHKSQLPETSPDSEVKSGWQNETEQRGEPIKTFLSKDSRREVDKEHNKRYNHFEELHFSGSNSDVMEKIKTGDATIIRAETLYQNGDITQIHVIFDNEGAGHNIDVYLTNRALKDFLEENK